MALEKIGRVSLLSVLTGITFFGTVRTISAPCVAFDPKLHLMEETEDLIFSLSLIAVVALSFAPMYAAAYRSEDSRRDFENWFKSFHWSIKGPATGILSSLLFFGFLQALQAIVRNIKENAALSEMGNFVELMVSLALFAVGGSVVAAAYCRRQAIHENAEVSVPLSQQFPHYGL